MIFSPAAVILLINNELGGFVHYFISPASLVYKVRLYYISLGDFIKIFYLFINIKNKAQPLR